MKYKACGLLMNDIAPESFQNIGKKICDQVDSLSITDETTTTEIKQNYNKPALENIKTDRMSVQRKILNKWIPVCYRNYEYLTILSN